MAVPGVRLLLVSFLLSDIGGPITQANAVIDSQVRSGPPGYDNCGWCSDTFPAPPDIDCSELATYLPYLSPCESDGDCPAENCCCSHLLGCEFQRCITRRQEYPPREWSTIDLRVT